MEYEKKVLTIIYKYDIIYIESEEKKMMRVEITKVCPFCGKITAIEVTEEQMFAYFFTDELVQNIFPEMEASTREVLISGICKDCQKEIF